ncbi:MAG: PGPGW domain-containing protein [Candidatus Woesebacteria bacterium]|jgi:uncharacterized protein (TIGR02611 family)
MKTLKKRWQKTPATVRKPIITLIGGAIIIAGIVMLALPGPGWATIFLGLAILATEFATANKLKIKLIDKFKQAAEAAKKHLTK